MHHETKERPRLDPAAFYGLPGQIVRLIEPHSEGDPAAILLQLLAGVGCAAGRRVHLTVEATPHFPNLFCLIVGSTSKARKGTSFNWVSRVLGDIDGDLPTLGGLSTGQGLVSAIRDGSDECEGVLDKRLLVVESEFAGLLANAGRRENNLSPTLRDAWDGRTLRTVTRADPLTATDPHVAIIGHITAEELTRRLSENEQANGFANRFLFAWAARSKLLPEGGQVDLAELCGLSRELRTNVFGVCEGHEYRLAEGARQYWRDLYARLADDDCGGLVGTLTARAEPQILRLAMIYALCAGSYEIELEHLQAAAAVVDYSAQSVRHIFGDRSGDPVADKIEGALRDAPDGLTRSEISGLLGRNQPADKITAALASLETAGKIEVIHEPGSGRTATIFRSSSGFARMLGGLN